MDSNFFTLANKKQVVPEGVHRFDKKSKHIGQKHLIYLSAFNHNCLCMRQYLFSTTTSPHLAVSHLEAFVIPELNGDADV